jgi:hypothetical protein
MTLSAPALVQLPAGALLSAIEESCCAILAEAPDAAGSA